MPSPSAPLFSAMAALLPGLLATLAPAQVFTSTASILTTAGAGEVTTLYSEGNWRSTWHLAVRGEFDGIAGEDVLVYDRITGEGRFMRVDAVTGNLTTIAAQATWATTWDQIVPGNFGGNAQTDLLFYNAQSGIARIYTTGPGAVITLLASFSGWQEWDRIVAGQFATGSTSDLFFYSRTRGEGKFFASDALGNLTLQQTYTTLDKNWDQITVGDYNGDGWSDLFFYQRVRGWGRFYTTNGSGGLTLLQAYTGLRTSWDLVVGGDFGGSARDDLLFYDRTAGEARFAFTDGLGGWTLQPLRSVPRTWSHLTPGAYSSGLTRVFAYDNTLRLRIHAVKCEDDDGSRSTAITPAQVQLWVDKANECYARAGVRLEFNPTTDFQVLRSTLVNTLDVCAEFPSQAQCDVHKAGATLFASQFPCKVVLLFRWGADPTPTGTGFSSETANYVAMTGFNDTQTKAWFQDPSNPLHGQTVQGIKLLAHELGHYFGLDHSGIDWNYAATPSAHAQVVGYLSGLSNPSAESLDPDHDDTWDTPPDVHRDYYLHYGWNPADLGQEITINAPALSLAFTFSPDRHNVMSYFGIVDDYLRLSPDQVREIRQVLHTSKAQLLDPCAHTVVGTWAPYGTGCPGTGGAVPLHTVGGTIATGQTLQLTVSNSVPGTAAIALVGNPAVAVPLASAGMGSCQLLVGNFATAVFGLTGAGSGSLPVTVPTTAALVGSFVHTQIAVFDAGAPTPLQIVMTRGAQLRIGGNL